VIHLHGTPITPRARLLELAGRHFCVSYADPRDVQVCHEIGQSVMLDNGAFSFWRKNRPTDWGGFAEWARPWLDYQTTWAVMPDVINGTAEENDELIVWLYAHAKDVWERSAPVWHMHEPIERFQRLCHGYQRVCVGSSGQFAVVGDDRWHRRMEQAMNAVCGNGPAPVWLHMLRGLALAGSDYPFASADSTSIARNHKGDNTRGTPRKDVRLMADRIDAKQCPARWRYVQQAMELTA
jgi:hypothetical protein